MLEYTDLVLLDIKHIDKEKYTKLTSVRLDNTLKFAEYLGNRQKYGQGTCWFRIYRR